MYEPAPVDLKLSLSLSDMCDVIKAFKLYLSSRIINFFIIIFIISNSPKSSDTTGIRTRTHDC